MLKKLFIIIVLSFSSVFSFAKDNVVTGKKAEEMFKNVYNMVFGTEGSSLTYNINIIGLYKTTGDIVYKGKKRYYDEDRYMGYEDGVTSYMVDKKKKTVNIFNYNDENKNSMLKKFSYDLNNFEYSYYAKGDFYFITAKVKNPTFFGIKYLELKVLKKNLYPQSVAIKLAILRTTIVISKFRTRITDESVFKFPKEKFKGYTFTDHR